ncbi:MAG: carboxypeptidase-like regulatory domain-containing protein [Bacteroidales bacterium]|nr:carboxypeptidase-like regulatory domain-containing protein [Bacteroidales bacterium]
MKRLVCIIATIFFVSNISYSQTFKIKGKVSDNNGKPLPYVNIYIKSINIGTVTNNEGYFFINIPLKHKKDTLCFSYIGYKKYEIPLKTIKFSFLKITLSLTKTTLNTVKIAEKRIDTDKIIKKIYKNIDNNTPPTNYLLNFYVRKYVKNDKHNKFVFLREIAGEAYVLKNEHDMLDKVKPLGINEINKGVPLPTRKDTISEGFAVTDYILLKWNLKFYLKQLKKY